MDEAIAKAFKDINQLWDKPRKASRIPGMIEVLLRVWLKYPDMRLGQIILNGVRLAGKDQVGTFYIEDEALKVGLEKLADGGK